MSRGDWISGQIDVSMVGPLDLVDILNEVEGGVIGLGLDHPANEALAKTYTHWRRVWRKPSRPQAGQAGYVEWLVGEMVATSVGGHLPALLAVEAADLIRAYEESAAENRRLVRELDVALCGEAGAAKQASLVDIVGTVKDKRTVNLTLNQLLWFAAAMRGLDEKARDVPADLFGQALIEARTFRGLAPARIIR